jgi:hypothetical protein
MSALTLSKQLGGTILFIFALMCIPQDVSAEARLARGISSQATKVCLNEGVFARHI